MGLSIFGVGKSSNFGSLEVILSFSWENSRQFIFGDGESFTFGRLKIVIGFTWELSRIFGTVLGKGSSLFRLAMLDAYGLVAHDFDGVWSV